MLEPSEGVNESLAAGAHPSGHPLGERQPLSRGAIEHYAWRSAPTPGLRHGTSIGRERYVRTTHPAHGNLVDASGYKAAVVDASHRTCSEHPNSTRNASHRLHPSDLCRGSPSVRELLRTQAGAAQSRERHVWPRLGGDEFALALAYTGLDQARTLASRLVEQLSAPHPIGTVRATITASLGISHFPGTANDVDTLMRKADHAMYSANAAGKRCVVWSQRARPLSSKPVPTMDRPAARQPLTSYIISSGGIQPACSLPFRALPQYSGPP
jgi:hypothetical protein